ncbi:hypothetical protein [Novosphingobium sp. CF614]|uniref:hypothetical protein n=1 Tax=Novosphingobium sp. CF614 TaxID=1884364 RepID=UPI00116049B8|nr:hypothetical protein [Novosphingobium sp. CF614]
MPKVSVVPLEKIVPVETPPGFSGKASTAAYLAGGRDPLHLHLHSVEPGASLRIGPLAVDCLAYVWTGEVEADGHRLAAGSSLVVEHGAALAITGGLAPAKLLTFAAADVPQSARPGGHVHLLPVERVERVSGMMQGVNGGMHFDSACPTCEIWLHENEFTPAFLTPETERRSPHSHTEDEIIFVTAGQMKLGNRLYGPGTALAVSAETMYSFNPGPEGLSFINFRAATPGDIRRADGNSSSETGGWRRQLGGKRPDYIEPA